tara:strand:+ start:823 stop:1434 length:612 start_codon:yes stop_codon:yes gene_type:complete
MATFKRHQASISNVGSYQVSGYPWISGSLVTKAGSDTDSTAEFHYQFPRVAKSVTVYFQSGTAGDADAGNSSAGLRVHFHTTGAVSTYHAASNPAGHITATDGTGLDTIADGTRCTSAVLKGRHFIELNSVDESITFNTKCTEIFVSRADCADNAAATDIEVRVIAELTNISVAEFSAISGSGLTTDGAPLGTEPVSASANQS